MSAKLLYNLVSLTVIAFISNVIWENLQAPLYKGYSSFWQHFYICFIATLGDVLIILFVFAIFTLLYRNAYWFYKMSSMQVIILAILGAIIAISMEVFALNVGRWAYTNAMPTIGGIGIFPVLQLAIILPLTFYLTSKFIKND